MEGGINKKEIDHRILQLSVPAVVSNLSVPLLGLADTAITGHLGSPVYLGGIAVGAMMGNVAMWLFGFLRMGTSGLAAQAYGAGSSEGIRTVISQAFYLALFIGLLLIAVSGPLCQFLLTVMGAEAGVNDIASRYFRLTIFGAPAQLATMSLIGWFFGMQTTLWPMIITICINVINIALSLILVFAVGMGFYGVAWGTLISTWLGLLIAVAIALKFSKGKLFMNPLKALRQGTGWHRFFSVNSDILLRSGCILAVTMAVTAFGARQGEVVLAANAVLLQFVHFFSYFMDGPAFTAEILCGRFAGAEDRQSLRLSVKRLLLWSGVLAGVFFIIYSLWGVRLASLLTDSAIVIEQIDKLRVWLALVPPLTVSAYIFDGIFIGLTATRRMLIATLSAAAIFFAIESASTFLPEYINADQLLWTAYLAYLVVRGLVLGIMAPKVLRIGICNKN